MRALGIITLFVAAASASVLRQMVQDEKPPESAIAKRQISDGGGGGSRGRLPGSGKNNNNNDDSGGGGDEVHRITTKRIAIMTANISRFVSILEAKRAAQRRLTKAEYHHFREKLNRETTGIAAVLAASGMRDPSEIGVYLITVNPLVGLEEAVSLALWALEVAPDLSKGNDDQST